MEPVRQRDIQRRFVSASAESAQEAHVRMPTRRTHDDITRPLQRRRAGSLPRTNGCRRSCLGRAPFLSQGFRLPRSGQRRSTPGPVSTAAQCWWGRMTDREYPSQPSSRTWRYGLRPRGSRLHAAGSFTVTCLLCGPERSGKLGLSLVVRVTSPSRVDHTR